MQLEDPDVPHSILSSSQTQEPPLSQGLLAIAKAVARPKERVKRIMTHHELPPLAASVDMDTS
jgi:hypothetical protein